MDWSMIASVSCIALDGPAASGKTTVGVRLAEKLGFLYFDTGVMYRAVAYQAIQTGIAPEEEDAVSKVAERIVIDVQPPAIRDGRACTVLVGEEDVTWAIRSPEVDATVSRVAAYSRVRTAMTRKQRAIGERGRVVMVGRDVGTVVMPDAGLKIFLDASLEERARRRFAEQRERGGHQTYDDLRSALERRDVLDASRAIAPLKAAEDAVRIDSTGQDVEQIVQQIQTLFAERR
jgi:cytidylate kinase